MLLLKMRIYGRESSSRNGPSQPLPCSWLFRAIYRRGPLELQREQAQSMDLVLLLFLIYWWPIATVLYTTKTCFPLQKYYKKEMCTNIHIAPIQTLKIKQYSNKPLFFYLYINRAAALSFWSRYLISKCYVLLKQRQK